MTARIRLATFADAAELARLRWDFSPDEVAASGQPYDEFAAGFADFLRHALAGGDWAIWVAEERGRLIANVYVRVIGKVPRPGRFGAAYGYVTNVYAEPGARNRGTGSALLRAVIAWARERRLEFLIVWPAEESVRFYERAGFRRAAEAMELEL
jgi:GNAT superfamily N-acetyltransferase